MSQFVFGLGDNFGYTVIADDKTGVGENQRPQSRLTSDTSRSPREHRYRRGGDRRSTRRDTRAESNQGDPELQRTYALGRKMRNDSLSPGASQYAHA
jgi:hypothetical protein